MGLITGTSSSLNLPEDGGNDTVSALNATGVDTFTVSARPSCASAACTLPMAGTRSRLSAFGSLNTSFPTATPLICVAG